MTTTATVIHSSDLTAACPRAVELRLDGKAIGEYTTALFRGQLAGVALEILHGQGLKGSVKGVVCVEATTRVLDMAADENRPPSDAVMRELEAIQAEVTGALTLYVGRFRDYFAQCKIIGCEVPVSWESDGLQFASHLDLLFREPNGDLYVWDWKWRDQSPMFAYLSRNMQLAMYALCCRDGQVRVGGEWVRLNQWPVAAWVHLPNLEPYKRAGEGYRKGDARPLDKIVREVRYDDSSRDTIIREVMLRKAMMDAGHFPAIPDPVGCHLCDCAAHCPQHHGGTNATL